MDEKELRTASFLLFQKVQIAIAILVIRSTPSNMTTKNHAVIFQRKFRKTAKRVNIQLERQIFYEQLLVLLPALKIYTECRPDFGEPMDIDIVDYEYNSVNEIGLLMNPVNEEYSNFILMLTSTSQFLDAIMETKLLSDKNVNITRTDILNLLSKFQETDSLQLLNEDVKHQYYYCVSSSLLNYVMKSFNMDHILDECSVQMMKSIQEYFSRSSQEIINAQGFSCIQYASKVLLKYFENHPNDRNQPLLSKFVQKTTRTLLFKEHDLFYYWYMLLDDWKCKKQICIAILDSLFSVIAKEYDNRNTMPENLCGLLNSIKKLLIFFYKLHRKTNNFRIAEKEIFAKSFFTSWEKIIKMIIISSIDKKQRLQSQLSWNCLQVIMLLKCRIRSDCETRHSRN